MKGYGGMPAGSPWGSATDKDIQKQYVFAPHLSAALVNPLLSPITALASKGFPATHESVQDKPNYHLIR